MYYPKGYVPNFHQNPSNSYKPSYSGDDFYPSEGSYPPPHPPGSFRSPHKPFGLYKPPGFDISGPPQRQKPSFNFEGSSSAFEFNGPSKFPEGGTYNGPPGPDIQGPPHRHNSGPFPHSGRPSGGPEFLGFDTRPRGPPIGSPPGKPKPEHELEHFGPLSNYVPGADYEALKEAAGPPVTLDFQGPPGPPGSPNDEEGHDTYFNPNELPPTPSDFGPTADGPEGIPSTQGGPFRVNDGPSVNDPFIDPFGDGSFPKGPNQFGGPESSPEEASEGFEPPENPPPSGPPRSSGSPFDTSGPPRSSYNPNAPSGPSGPAGPTGPSGPPSLPTGPSGPSGPPRGRGPPLDYRKLHASNPLRWNDPDFYFDHDFKPTRPQGRGPGGPYSTSSNGPGTSGGSFFDDFSGFYQSNQRAVGPPGPQEKSFGDTDGFPNYFEGEENPRRQQVDSNVAFETFADGRQRPNGPPGPPGTFRHHRAGPIKIPNRRILQILQTLKKQLPPTTVK